MAIRALGPTFAGGMQPIVRDGYELIYFPDVQNFELQKNGQNPVFYWMPNYVHIARKNGNEDGDLMFNMIRFAGVQSSETTVGMDPGETREVAGGVVSFTTTSAPTDEVLLESQKQITELFQGQEDYFWGIRSSRKPVFRPVPILSNITTVSNLSPLSDGTVPTIDTNNSVDEPAARALREMNEHSSIQGLVSRSGNENHLRKTVPFQELDEVKTRSSLDPWYWEMQGQGNGSIDPMGQNAYTALVGAYPTALLWESFHGAYTPVFVQQALKIKFWTPAMAITITGKWERIFQHFSAHAKGKGLWFSADIKAELNNLRTTGDVVIDILLDETLPNADKLREYIEKRTNLVYEKFMEMAKTIIFDKPAPEVEAAQASSGGGILGFGAGLALKFRRDKISLASTYTERRQIAYLQDHTISSSLEGMYDEIEGNPAAEEKYFKTIYLDDWPRKISRVVKPIGLKSGPIAFMSAQLGYPNTDGELMWIGKPFQKSDPDDYSWNIGITQKNEADVDNPPADWSSDTTFVKRAIHMNEPLSAFESPFSVIQILDNIIYLDEGENGSALNDVALEIRADEASRIAVGPINIGVNLENSSQIVEVTFRASDEDENPLDDIAPIKFTWKMEDQEESRFWAIYSSNKNIDSYYQYQVRVIVKGSLFTKGMEWTGPWTQSFGNGPLMISVPTPEDDGVVVTRTIDSEAFNNTSNGSGTNTVNETETETEAETEVDNSAPPTRTAPPKEEHKEEELEFVTYHRTAIGDRRTMPNPENPIDPPPTRSMKNGANGKDQSENIKYKY